MTSEASHIESLKCGFYASYIIMTNRNAPLLYVHMGNAMPVMYAQFAHSISYVLYTNVCSFEIEQYSVSCHSSVADSYYWHEEASHFFFVEHSCGYKLRNNRSHLCK